MKRNKLVGWLFSLLACSVLLFGLVFFLTASTTSISAAEPSGVSSAASDVAPLPSSVPGLGISTEALDPIQKFVITQSASHAWIAWLITAVVSLRFVNKPIFAYLHFRASQSSDPKEDARITAIEQSTWIKVLNFGLDWIASWKPVPKASAAK